MNFLMAWPRHGMPDGAVGDFPIVFEMVTAQCQGVRPTTVRTELPSTVIPASTPADGVSAGAGLPSNWLESGMALLDKAGRIAEVDEALASWLGRGRSE